HHVFYPVVYDERGETATSPPWTGSMTDGTHGTPVINCGDFISQSGAGYVGEAYGGPTMWSSGTALCQTRHPLFCVMVDKQVQVSEHAVPGKKMWVGSTSFSASSSLTGADGVCQGVLPTGVVSSHAFIAAAARTPSSLLADDQLYVRPDGIP